MVLTYLLNVLEERNLVQEQISVTCCVGLK